MYGFEAITANNGWSMAIVGASIDFTGLFVLSIVISQLHKLLEYLEQRKAGKEETPETAEISGAKNLAKGSSVPEIFPEDIFEVVPLYQPLIQEIGETFELNTLYKLAKEKNYPHPHLTIRSFRDEGILIPDGDGIFKWTQ